MLRVQRVVLDSAGRPALLSGPLCDNMRLSEAVKMSNEDDVRDATARPATIEAFTRAMVRGDGIAATSIVRGIGPLLSGATRHRMWRAVWMTAAAHVDRRDKVRVLRAVIVAMVPEQGSALTKAQVTLENMSRLIAAARIVCEVRKSGSVAKLITTILLQEEGEEEGDVATMAESVTAARSFLASQPEERRSKLLKPVEYVLSVLEEEDQRSEKRVIFNGIKPVDSTVEVFGTKKSASRSEHLSMLGGSPSHRPDPDTEATQYVPLDYCMVGGGTANITPAIYAATLRDISALTVLSAAHPRFKVPTAKLLLAAGSDFAFPRIVSRVFSVKDSKFNFGLLPPEAKVALPGSELAYMSNQGNPLFHALAGIPLYLFMNSLGLVGADPEDMYPHALQLAWLTVEACNRHVIGVHSGRADVGVALLSLLEITQEPQLDWREPDAGLVPTGVEPWRCCGESLPSEVLEHFLQACESGNIDMVQGSLASAGRWCMSVPHPAQAVEPKSQLSRLLDLVVSDTAGNMRESVGDSEMIPALLERAMDPQQRKLWFALLRHQLLNAHTLAKRSHLQSVVLNCFVATVDALLSSISIFSLPTGSDAATSILRLAVDPIDYNPDVLRPILDPLSVSTDAHEKPKTLLTLMRDAATADDEEEWGAPPPPRPASALPKARGGAGGPAAPRKTAGAARLPPPPLPTIFGAKRRPAGGKRTAKKKKKGKKKK